MANLNKTRTALAVTSPRTTEKIIPEIGLLIDRYAGQKWSGNSKLQSDYCKDLYASEFYKGRKLPKDLAFAARDRITRAPKALGFVDLTPVISLTPAGESLLSGKRVHERITKQLLKFQLPSPYHTSKTNAFFVRPYLELLRLIKDLNGLSKTEMALFFLQLTHINKYEQVADAVRAYRVKAQGKTISHKIFVHAYFEEVVKEIYAAEIAGGKTKIRESKDASLKKFITTKHRNMLDFADAFQRYLRATSLVTHAKGTYRLIIAPSKLDEVEFILANTEREPVRFSNTKQFKAYLFSSTNLPLLVDDEALLLAKLAQRGHSIRTGTMPLEALKDLLETTESELLEKRKEEVKSELKDFQQFEAILSVFDQIKKKEVPDPALFLEWNVWRALVMLNYAVATKGNFVMDPDNAMPVYAAPGKLPDIEVDYGDFGMIVEVTMSSGQKQYDMEGEPVARHFGRAREAKEDMYCLFIAPSISEGTLAHYFNLNKMNTRHYGGKTRIVPLTVAQFVDFLSLARKHGFNDPHKVKHWLNGACEFNQDCEDEVAWQKHIASSMKTWAA